jgi:tetratricopeptide (TPR) repeat protein
MTAMLPLGERLSRWLELEKVGWLLAFRMRRKAIDALEALRVRYPQDSSICQRLGYLLAQDGRAAEALSFLQQAAQLAPSDAAAHYNLGFIQQEQGMHEAAIASFDAVLAIKPEHDLALYGKALSLISTQRQTEAIPLLKQVIKLQPMSPYAYYQLARVYHEQGKTEKLARIVGELRKFEPKVADQLERETGIRSPLS